MLARVRPEHCPRLFTCSHLNAEGWTAFAQGRKYAGCPTPWRFWVEVEDIPGRMAYFVVRVKRGCVVAVAHEHAFVEISRH